MDDSGIKLTPALRRVLEFIASGGRASSQLQALRNAGYVEYHDPPEGGPDRIRITAAGRSALTQQASLSYRRDGDRYIVHLGDDRIGFVRYASNRRRWNAVDTTMAYIRWFDTRDAAGKSTASPVHEDDAGRAAVIALRSGEAV